MLLAGLGHRVAVLERSRTLGDTLSTHGLARGGVVQLHRWGLLDPVLATGAPAATAVGFGTADGEYLRRPLRRSAGVDLLLAPRRSVLDGLLLGAAEEAGATVLRGVEVTGLLRDGGHEGRVRGITGRGPAGDAVRMTARLVVGADGLRSRVARAVQAPVRREGVSPASTYYAYVPGLPQDTYQFHVGASCFAGVFPTHHGEGCVWLSLPTEQSDRLRTAGARRAEELITTLRRRTPALGEQLTARPTSPVRGAVGLPMVLRDAAGPGWALVGDAGYHRDPITGHGITDAFRDAELLACAASAWLGSAPGSAAAERSAMAGYQQQRDAQVEDVFRLTDALTRFPEPARFVALQRELAEALDREAEWLAARPALAVPDRARDLVPA
jgi:2-polyprenyl-6-methoxyphenol hydroxylase-like FAD-dependent oxidoreductase